MLERVTIVMMTVGDGCLVTVVIVTCRDSDPEEQGVGEARDVDDHCGRAQSAGRLSQHQRGRRSQRYSAT